MCDVFITSNNTRYSSYIKKDGTRSLKAYCNSCDSETSALYKKVHPLTERQRVGARLAVRKWAKNNPDYAKARNKSPEQKARLAKWYIKNKESVKLKTAKRQKDNPRLYNHYCTKSKLKYCTPSWANLSDIRQFYLNCPDGHEVDHIIPIGSKSVSGLHVINNLQYLTPKANKTKSNRY